MKRTLMWLVVVVMCLALLWPILVSCEAAPTSTPTLTAPTSTPTSTTAPGFKWPITLFIGTHPVGTGTYALLSAFAPVMEEGTGMKVRVSPMMGLLRHNSLLTRESTIIGTGVVDVPGVCRGEGEYLDTPKAMEMIVWSLSEGQWLPYVRGDSKIQSLDDMKKLVEAGEKVTIATLPSGPSLDLACAYAFPAFLGLKHEDFSYYDAPNTPAMWKSVVEGKADVTLGGTASGSFIEAASSPVGVRLLEMPSDDVEGWKGFTSYRTMDSPATITVGLSEAIGKQGYTSPHFLFALPETDEELIYNTAKWIHENYDDYKDLLTTFQFWDIDNFRKLLDTVDVPVHPGTVRYLREIGKWTAADDAWNAESMKKSQSYVDAWEDASAVAEGRNIKIDMENEEWKELWASYIKDLPIHKVRLP